MSIIETEIRKMRMEFKKEINDLKRIIVTKMTPDKWVDADVACAMMNIKTRQLQNVRLHNDKDNKRVGFLRWKKGAGRNVKYYLPDIENYNSTNQVLQ